MIAFVRLANLLVAAALALGLSAHASHAAGGEPLEDLYRQLADPDTSDWPRVEVEITRAWSRSGSSSMDLLLRRGRNAIRARDYEAAIDHLTALVEQAPDFAEGWNARATAWYAMGEYGLSVEDIARTLSLNPHHFGALAGLGAIYERIGLESRALQAYRAALAIHPHIETVMQSVERLEERTRGQAI
ncbi:MAG: hypothetical protein JJU40_03610 [Rhodobacteraceae bacterium]|nr:hypothetical protein [Paracoccaceae bacterium]